MLLRGSAEYIKDPKVACMMDMFPLKKTDAVFPSPRVLNTHYRLDVLPKEFRGRKTVLGIIINLIINAKFSFEYFLFIRYSN